MKQFTFVFIVMVLLSGCANRLYFGTATNLGVDFSETTANIGYKNINIANVPQKKDGTSHSVVGKSDVDISLREINIHEQFATGDAAIIATKNEKRDIVTTNDENTSNNLLFGSYSSISIFDFNFGSLNPFAGATIGYKRATATIIPVENNNTEIRSVYANTYITSLDKNASISNGTQTNGIRFITKFGTGKAAQQLAQKHKDEFVDCPE